MIEVVCKTTMRSLILVRFTHDMIASEIYPRACELAADYGYVVSVCWMKDHTAYAQPSMLNKVNAGDFTKIIAA